MKQIWTTAALVLALTGLANGQSVIHYSIGLGGNNHAEVHEMFGPPLFEPPFENVTTYQSGEHITWHVEVAVTGVHQGGSSDGTVPNGLAAMDFTLVLRDGVTGEPVPYGRAPGDGDSPSGPGFFSTINDGDSDGPGGIGPDDALENADFCRSFASMLGSGDGRIWDDPSNGGPGLRLIGYPSAAGYPYDSTTSPGYLEHMKAAYWQSNSALGVPGVGGSGPCALDVVPVAEGQILLPDGCYILEVIPEQDNRILTGSFDCALGLPEDFAAHTSFSNETTGDYITFTVGDVEPCLQPPTWSAASRRTHGSAGVFDLPVRLYEPPPIEPRSTDSGNPQFVITYTSPPSDPGCDGLTIVNGNCTLTSMSGNDLIIDMQFEPNSCVRITEPFGQTFTVLTHQGNVNGDPDVNVIDMQEVKNHIFEPVNESTFLYDINADGSINVIDLQDTKNNIFASASCE